MEYKGSIFFSHANLAIVKKYVNEYLYLNTWLIHIMYYTYDFSKIKEVLTSECEFFLCPSTDKKTVFHGIKLVITRVTYHLGKQQFFFETMKHVIMFLMATLVTVHVRLNMCVNMKQI